MTQGMYGTADLGGQIMPLTSLLFKDVAKAEQCIGMQLLPARHTYRFCMPRKQHSQHYCALCQLAAQPLRAV